MKTESSIEKNLKYAVVFVLLVMFHPIPVAIFFIPGYELMLWLTFTSGLVALTAIAALGLFIHLRRKKTDRTSRDTSIVTAALITLAGGLFLVWTASVFGWFD